MKTTINVQCEEEIIFSDIVTVTDNKIITGPTVLAPRHERCTLNVTFSNNVSTSEPLIWELSE